MADTPNLDWLAEDAHHDLWRRTLTLDEHAPPGRPDARACRVCAGETVRMRQAVGRPVGGRLVWVCERCDRADSGLRLPRGWGA